MLDGAGHTIYELNATAENSGALIPELNGGTVKNLHIRNSAANAAIIAKGTGTLLSPNDRTLGESFPDDIVLTLYKVTGEKGWNGEKLWIPNIKLPAGRTYYGIEE